MRYKHIAKQWIEPSSVVWQNNTHFVFSPMLTKALNLSHTYTGRDCPICGIFDMDVIFFGRAKISLNLAFSAGSSKHGRARRASVGWNCVAATHLRTSISNCGNNQLINN